MKTPALLLALALVAGCAAEGDGEFIETPVVGEAEAVTEVEAGPADDSLLIEDDSLLLDPTYVPEEESVEGGLTEGEVLDPDDG